MLKKLSFLLVLSIGFIACESESVEEAVLIQNDDQEIENENDNDGEVDIYIDGNKGL
ncbi:hypothetical protein [Aquimarina brevivitae]|uniref:Uncharacterized protein n=1 Tax=Aquimarina brevivitae TaxID=323412 RepID=A0A4Q7PI74_9FLAO|nr:hypothetical protein [Aquimarina brevivitae]RZT00304.1 hypothetical protein EV197_1540 [Aquimarina brevivitae]